MERKSRPTCRSGLCRIRRGLSLFLTFHFLGGLGGLAFAGRLTRLTVEIETADAFLAGTDDDVSLQLFVGDRFEKRSYDLDDRRDNFERNRTDTFDLTADLPGETSQIRALRIHKSPDSFFGGGWKLGGLRIWANGDPAQVIYENASIGEWLEDGHRDWAPPFNPGRADAFVPEPRPLPLPPAPLPPRCRVGGSGGTTVGGGGSLPDGDCDGIADPDDPDYDPADCDGDGIADAAEDWNGNGFVDPGETDRCNTPGGAADLPDTDADGLPDVYEDADRDGTVGAGETDPRDPDTDGDGWSDGPRNTRLELVLARIHCHDEDEDIGRDELFPVIDDVRFPADPGGLDGVYRFDEGDDQYPMTVVARRVVPPGLSGPLEADLDLWEDDLFDFTDDHAADFTLRFAPEETFLTHRLRRSDYDYTLDFHVERRHFADPNPTDDRGDTDALGPVGNRVAGDGLGERVEYELSLGLPVRGLADPLRKDLFVELDSTSRQQVPEEYSKMDVVSQFFYHGIAMHLADEDSRLGGGQVLDGIGGSSVHLRADDGSPSVEGLFDDPASFDPLRRGTFTYAVAADEVVGGTFSFGRAIKPDMDDDGRALRPRTPPCPAGSFQPCDTGSRFLVFKSDFLDHLTDLESIVFFHELGHTMGLCHRPRDQGLGGNVTHRPSVADACGCSKFRDDNGNGRRDAGEEEIRGSCTHYSVDEDSDTAMGTYRYSGQGALAGALGGAAGGGLGGALVGAFVGALAPGVIGLVDREIDYTDEEWSVIDLTTIR